MKRIIIVIFIGIFLQVGMCLLSGVLIDHRWDMAKASAHIQEAGWGPGREIEVWGSAQATHARIHYYSVCGSPGEYLPGTVIVQTAPEPHRRVLCELEDAAWEYFEQTRGNNIIEYVSYGVPFRATYGAVEMNRESTYFQPFLKSYLMNYSEGIMSPLRIVCWGIYWKGFVGNSLIYAFVVGLPYFGYRKVRRIVRHRRGVCPVCGYDLRGSGVEVGCPECGWGRGVRMVESEEVRELCI